MAKKRSLRRDRAKPRQEPAARPGKWKSLLRKLSSPIGILFASVSFLIAVGGAYYQFQAKVSLQPELALRSDSVIDTPFRLTNESLLPIDNIKQEWLVERDRFRVPSGSGIPFSELSEVGPIEIPPEKNTISSLPSSQSVTLYPFDYMEDKTEDVRLNRLRMIVDITYQTAIFRLRRTQTFCFQGNMAADGSFHWYPTQESELKKP